MLVICWFQNLVNPVNPVLKGFLQAPLYSPFRVFRVFRGYITLPSSQL